jgi:hypothetical protein
LGARFPALSRLALVALLAACASTSSASPPPAAVDGCRGGAPEAGVYHPDRLQVLDPCRRGVGIVVDVAHEGDGDYHIWFKADAGYEGLLNAEDHFQARPAMLAELTPDCATDPPDAQAASRCPRSRLPIPSLGDHVVVQGPWVLDMDHGWQEIHPVDSISILARA